MKVSVIIPVYNTEKYLAECLDSILNQTLDSYEIIIVNDGSTDGSLQLINQYAKRYSNISVINQNNQKQGAARNAGLKVANGEYVCFIDSDDMLEKNALDYCYNLASKINLDMITYAADIFGDIIGKSSEQYFFHKRINDINKVMYGVDFIKRYYYRVSMLNITFTLYLRTFLLNNKLFFLEKTFYEDLEFYYRTMECNPRMMIIDNEFYHRRYRDNSVMTSSKTELSVMNKIYIYENIMKKSINIVKSLYTMVGMRGIRRALQESKKINLALEQNVLNNVYNTIKKIDMRDCNISVLIDIQYCSFFLNDIEKKYKFDERVYQIVNESLKEVLLKIDFYNARKTLGIYGRGDDCNIFLDLIERMFGKFRCKIINIQTDFIDKENSKKQNLFCVKNLTNVSMDTILIGTFYYENEIKENIRKYIKPEYEVFSLKNDFGYYKA